MIAKDRGHVCKVMYIKRQVITAVPQLPSPSTPLPANLRRGAEQVGTKALKGRGRSSQFKRTSKHK